MKYALQQNRWFSRDCKLGNFTSATMTVRRCIIIHYWNIADMIYQQSQYIVIVIVFKYIWLQPSNFLDALASLGSMLESEWVSNSRF